MFNFNSAKTIKLSPGLATITLNNFYDTDRSGAPLRSKSGNLMIKVEYRAVDEDSADDLIYDYIPIIPSMAWKAKLIAECFGVPNAFKDGYLDLEMLKGITGRVLLKLDESPGFDARIVIDRYIPSTEMIQENGKKIAKVKEVIMNDDFDDSIPF